MDSTYWVFQKPIKDIFGKAKSEERILDPHLGLQTPSMVEAEGKIDSKPLKKVKEAQLIERYGSGIKRIQQGFKVYGLKPSLFEEFQGGFRVTVYSSSDNLITPSAENTAGETVGETASIYQFKDQIKAKKMA